MDKGIFEQTAMDYAKTRQGIEVLKEERTTAVQEKVVALEKQIAELVKPWKDKLDEMSLEADNLANTLIENWDSCMSGKTFELPEIGEIQLRESEKVFTPDWQTENIAADTLVKMLLARDLNKTIKNITYDSKAIKGLLTAGMELPGVKTEKVRSIAFKESKA